MYHLTLTALALLAGGCSAATGVLYHRQHAAAKAREHGDPLEDLGLLKYGRAFALPVQVTAPLHQAVAPLQAVTALPAAAPIHHAPLVLAAAAPQYLAPRFAIAVPIQALQHYGLQNHIQADFPQQQYFRASPQYFGPQQHYHQQEYQPRQQQYLLQQQQYQPRQQYQQQQQQQQQQRGYGGLRQRFGDSQQQASDGHRSQQEVLRPYSRQNQEIYHFARNN